MRSRRNLNSALILCDLSGAFADDNCSNKLYGIRDKERQYAPSHYRCESDGAGPGRIYGHKPDYTHHIHDDLKDNGVDRTEDPGLYC